MSKGELGPSAAYRTVPLARRGTATGSASGARRLEELLYLDEDGLQRLFSQTTSKSRVGGSREVESERSGDVEAKPTIKLGHRLLGFEVSGSGGAKGGVRRRVTESENSEWRPENKIVIVREYLKSRGRLSLDVYSGTNHAKSSGGSAFCDLRGTFMPLGWGEATDAWRLRANAEQVLILEERGDPALKVGMSFSKIVFGAPLDQIRSLSHLAIRLRQPVGIRVLGSIDAGKYVKPYAASFL